MNSRLSFWGLAIFSFLLFLNASGCKSQEPVKNSDGSLTIGEPVASENKENQTNNHMQTDHTNTRIKVSTSLGEIVIRLYDETPQHRDNFIKLVETGFYNDLLFHRCIRGFMAQGGDPNSRGAAAGAQLGMGGPGYTVPAEFNSNFIHKKGALAAARQGDFANPTKASSGSQFYISQGQPMTDAQIDQVEQYVKQKNSDFSYTPAQREVYKTVGGTAQLDMDYTVFGEVVEGLDVLDKILSMPTGSGDRPVQDISMKMEVIK